MYWYVFCKLMRTIPPVDVCSYPKNVTKGSPNDQLILSQLFYVQSLVQFSFEMILHLFDYNNNKKKRIFSCSHSALLLPEKTTNFYLRFFFSCFFVCRVLSNKQRFSKQRLQPQRHVIVLVTMRSRRWLFNSRFSTCIYH